MTEPTFQPWDSDHTALVHVLWDAQSDGLIAKGVAKGTAIEDELASRIRQSDWMRAVRVHAAGELTAERDRLRAALEECLSALGRPEQPFREQVLDSLAHGGREQARDSVRVDRATAVLRKALAGGGTDD